MAIFMLISPPDPKGAMLATFKTSLESKIFFPLIGGALNGPKMAILAIFEPGSQIFFPWTP